MMAAGIRTTSDLAALAGLNQSMVRRWLLGKSTPDDNGRARLDAVLDRDDDAA
jgi:transcriptional regulator with XRE-family HTH domain